MIAVLTIVLSLLQMPISVTNLNQIKSQTSPLFYQSKFALDRSGLNLFFINHNTMILGSPYIPLVSKQSMVDSTSSPLGVPDSREI